MAGPIEESDFHVLVIGAGSVGLLIAQRLKMLGIKCTVFEREHYLNERPRDWSFGIYWAQSSLTECLPNSLISRLTTAQVDPLRTSTPDDYMRLMNGQTAGELLRVPTPNMYRLKRSKFRALLNEGIDVQYGKRLSTLSNNTYKGEPRATATFEDGSKATGHLLVGADGSKSIVRKYLLGPEIAALQPLPIMTLRATSTFPPEVAKKLAAELQGQVTANTYHPMGCVAFFPIDDVLDHERPETWTWTPSLTIRHEGGNDGLTTPAEIRSVWDQYAKNLADPFRSMMLSLPQDAVIWCERLSIWPTVAWDNKQGTVTLAGDAAHPMTPQRGQGLNNAVHDAANLCRALDEHVHGEKPLSDVLAAYETELVERGREAVLSSGRDSMMVLNWEQLMNSPSLNRGPADSGRR